MAMVSPRRFSSGQHRREGTAWPTTPLQPFANARLLLDENVIPGDTSSAVVGSHVLECFLQRDNYISAKENGLGMDTGDFTCQGYICRAARLGQGLNRLTRGRSPRPDQAVACRPLGCSPAMNRNLCWVIGISLK